MTNVEKYRQFCRTEKDIPIFSRSWWLDSICGTNSWNVALVEKGGEIMASLPYCLTRKLIFRTISMPMLTQTLGVYIKYPKGQKYYKRLSWEKEIMTELLRSLPRCDLFSQNFHKSVKNWLPFYWSGFSQSTRYTYVVENIDLSCLEENFETDIRRRRRKACKLGIEAIEGDSIEKFYELNKMTFERKDKKVPYSFEFVKNLYEVCVDNNAVKMFFAKYEENIIAANFLVYDDMTVYYLMGGIDSNFKDLGGMDVVMYEGIKFALESRRAFDFEGSMIESIEKYFRSFGAIQKPYFHISKINSRILKIAKIIKDFSK